MNLFAAEERERAAAPYERLARKALVAYGLERSRLDLVSDAARITYRALDETTKTAWALQTHPRGCDAREILRGLRWLAGLRRETSALVPEPVLTRSGELIQSLSTPGVPGFRQVTLSSWIDGRRLPSAEWTRAHARRAGQAIAGLHNHAESFELPHELALPETDIESLERAIDARALAAAVAPNEEALLTAASEAYRKGLSEAGTGREVAGLIHARLSSDHVLFSGESAGFVGFGGCRWGHYAYDVAAVSLSLRGTKQGEALTGALIEGYREARPDVGALPDLLPAFSALRLLEELTRLADRAESERPRVVGRIINQLRAALL
jgi:Ser/Thr protein kinase RdoA (MazF antagonist)